MNFYLADSFNTAVYVIFFINIKPGNVRMTLYGHSMSSTTTVPIDWDIRFIGCSSYHVVPFTRYHHLFSVQYTTACDFEKSFNSVATVTAIANA